jgi:hypothetical protein
LRAWLRVAVSQARRQEIIDAKTEQLLNDCWPQRPTPFLGGKTPLEAQHEPQLRPGLVAALLFLETMPPLDAWKGFGKLWERLGLEHDIEGAPDQGPDRLTELPRMVPERLQDATLADAAFVAGLMGVRSACERFAPAVLRRHAWLNSHDARPVLITLHRSVATATTRLAIIRAAIEWYQARQQPTGEWRVHELRALLAMGQEVEAAEVFRSLTTAHRNDQRAMQLLFQTMQEMGLVGPDGQMTPAATQAQPAAAEAADTATIWTPDQQPAQATSERPKLWLPGME